MWDANETVDYLQVPSHPIPQLHSFIVQDIWSHRYASALIQFRFSDGHLSIRFDRLKSLAVNCHYMKGVQALKVIFKEAGELETLACKAHKPEALQGLAGWINVSAFSTLTTLKMTFSVMRFNEVNLQALCDELDLFPRNNVLEILDIEMDVSRVHTSTREEQWGRLDRVLSCGFSRLRRVAVGVVFLIGMELSETAQIQKFEEISRTEFTWLRENTAVDFDFSTSSK
jgi:hypothetical protein